MTLAPNFSRRSTHLLCPSAAGAKFDKAREWGVPVVNIGWLSEIATTGVIPDVDKSRVECEMDVDVEPVLGAKSVKAKGKEREVVKGMMDVTNSESSFFCGLLEDTFGKGVM